VTDRADKAWSGRFSQRADPAAEAFTSSLAFDRRLWPYDLEGSAAWARALGRAGLLRADELTTILQGLEAVKAELDSGTFPFRRELEDIHMNVERRLTELAGPVGGKLHTGRSRNDQIALDERLYLRDILRTWTTASRRSSWHWFDAPKRFPDCWMPGYTHLQRAQPVLLAHHLLAYVFMLERTASAFRTVRARERDAARISALAGTAFPIDREQLARDLGFAAPSPNSMDAVADRDYILEFLSHAAILGMHLSRLSADLTLWASAEFGFVEFSDAFATGSSIMPQKKNPDVAELIRGKTGRLYGNAVAAMVTMKGLPLTYNSDMQEDKEPLFDTVDTLEAILRVAPPMLATLDFKVERMRQVAGAHYATATDLADYLVRKGLPFRDAHEIVGKAVRYGIAHGKELGAMTLDEFRQLSPLIEQDVYETITVEASLRARSVTGGTAPEAVQRQLHEARKIIARGRPA
jgi:argininosuccinate lyase